MATANDERGLAARGRAGVQGLISGRSANWSTDGPNERFMRAQKPSSTRSRTTTPGWRWTAGSSFRTSGRLIGTHSGGSLTMDAWTLLAQWWRRFEGSRVLHGTAHDGLMAAPGLGRYLRLAGTLPARREALEAALAAGHDVAIWPGGEVTRCARGASATRWCSRAARASCGWRFAPGPDRARRDGRRARHRLHPQGGTAAREAERPEALARTERLPITLGVPFGITLELLPTHIPLPAKIRTELLEPVFVDDDPVRADDEGYVDDVYRDVELRIQAGVDRLARKRRFPIFGSAGYRCDGQSRQ